MGEDQAVKPAARPVGRRGAARREGGEEVVKWQYERHCRQNNSGRERGKEAGPVKMMINIKSEFVQIGCDYI